MTASPPRSRWKTWTLRLLKLAVVALVLWAVSGTLVDAWRQLRAPSPGGWQWTLEPGWVVLAGIIYLAGLTPAGLFWHRALRTLGQDARIGETLRAYFIGHLGKYVPGKALVVILRAGLIQSHRVSTSVAAVSVFFETLTMMAVGAFVAAAILAVWFREHLGLMLIALGLMALAGLPTLPPVFRRLVRLAGVGRSDPATAEKIGRVGFGTLALGWLAMLACWSLLGLSLWATLRGMGMTEADPLRDWPLYTACVSLAMVAGFLSLIPGGAVVREAVIMRLLVPYFAHVLHLSAAEAAVPAVLSAVLLRVSQLVAELLLSAVLYFLPLKK